MLQFESKLSCSKVNGIFLTDWLQKSKWTEKHNGRTKCQFSLHSEKVKAECTAVTNTTQVPVEGLTGMFDLTGPCLSNNKNEPISNVKLPTIQTHLLQMLWWWKWMEISNNFKYILRTRLLSAVWGYLHSIKRQRVNCAGNADPNITVCDHRSTWTYFLSMLRKHKYGCCHKNRNSINCTTLLTKQVITFLLETARLSPTWFITIRHCRLDFSLDLGNTIQIALQLYPVQYPWSKHNIHTSIYKTSTNAAWLYTTIAQSMTATNYYQPGWPSS
jgi:hypothetical protein